MQIYDLIISQDEAISLDDVFIEEEYREKIQRFVKEHSYREKLIELGLEVDHKIMLYGASGCGKTMTAKAIGNALGKKVLILNLSNIVCARIGETSQNLKQIFDKAKREKAILFLDEFDLLGKSRTYDDQDVGEMKRLVNVIIQQIDLLSSDVILICATNHAEMIDTALWRRFQLRIPYQLPDREALDDYYQSLRKSFPVELPTFDLLYDISYAEAKDYWLTEVKKHLIAAWEKDKEYL
ncbi:AAA family ATPase [Weeksella virosa]|uniref:AAA ATPase central domain protein n=1 Tax=Weeksella virosa (strain ATCC 43766 / DSM 16922 / JCM 21250 / CCUG 30538 / CDC 9751 / IAM 14551 / NBRC 16016 / NCTC 11634 / CL345/78) TaxID=865938 RepID=F0P090_WEEVC|nr:ATP-binding protein [Weeksella virosa]ADX68450.1 AAA ATPase central domain protein [Weeksella virosa DSM 16922]SUP54784.1 ATP-dependent zinc metalloprotease FtsH [Weeksella virosa]VEH63893.1 ATP-dependent zinc metalloprotease FtsH [Weeksella virosa]